MKLKLTFELELPKSSGQLDLSLFAVYSLEGRGECDLLLEYVYWSTRRTASVAASNGGEPK